MGVRLIWIVDPFQKMVIEHPLRGTIRQLELGSTLEGADVLPGFQLPLAELFEPPAL